MIPVYDPIRKRHVPIRKGYGLQASSIIPTPEQQAKELAKEEAKQVKAELKEHDEEVDSLVSLFEQIQKRATGKAPLIVHKK